jgi:predicted outer membrane repeat protein
MKKLLLLFFFCVFNLKSFADDVDNFATFQRLMSDGNNHDINMTVPIITATGDVGEIGAAIKNITSSIGGSVLYGNQKRGFDFNGVIATLNVDNVIISSFTNYPINMYTTGALGPAQVTCKFNNVTFLGNSNNQNAGVIYMENMSTLNVANSSVTFKGNSVTGANVGSGVINIVSSNFRTDSSIMNFISNDSVGDASVVGCFLGSTFSINNCILNFSSNSATKSDDTIAAMFLVRDDSHISMENTRADFICNKTNSMAGGMFKLEGGSMTVTNNSELRFIENSVAGEASAISASNSADIVFENSKIFVDSNTSAIGSAFYFVDTTLQVRSSSITFTNNKAWTESGGAMYLLKSTCTFTKGSNSNFTLNTSTSASAGAIYVLESSLTFADEVFFTSNTAKDAGGAMYVRNSQVELNDPKFKYNKVTGSSFNGGAITLNNSTITVNTSRQTVFEGNTANGLSSAIHIDNEGCLIFNNLTQNSVVEMKDAITSNGIGKGEIKLQGAGTFNLYATSTLTNVDLLINDSIEFNLKQGANLAAKSVLVGENAKFNIEGTKSVNNLVNNGKISLRSGFSENLQIQNFTNNGEIEMEIFDGQVSDKVTATNVTLGADSKLSVKMSLTYPRFKTRQYEIFVCTGSLTGTFKDIGCNGQMIKDCELIYIDNKIFVMINGYVGGNLAKTAELNRNQRESARALDVLAQDDSYPDLIKIIDIISDLNDGSPLGIINTKEALTKVSGHFLANVIRSGLDSNDKRDVYSRISSIERIDNNDKLYKNLWGHIIGDYSKYGSSKTTTGTYEAGKYGAIAGMDVDLYDRCNLILGCYAKVDRHNISNIVNRAQINNFGIGTYGGYEEDQWEVKACLNGNYDTYNTERHIKFATLDRTARADFSGFGFTADVEGAYKIELEEFLIFRPFIGAEFGLNSYGTITEKGADSLNLEVKSGNYLKTLLKAGLGCKKDIIRYSLFANLEYKQVLVGDLPEIDCTFEGTQEVFNSYGIRTGKNIFGIDIGGNYILNKDISLFAKTIFSFAKKYEDIYATVGAVYKFGVPRQYRVIVTKEDKKVSGLKKQINTIIRKRLKTIN